MPCKSVKVLLFSFLITYLLGGAVGGKKKIKDDDYDDSDEGCYPGRNCVSGCYCAGEECRPYNYSKSPHHSTYACRPFKYPKWKIWKKGAKDNLNNSTIIVMSHHSKLSEPLADVLTRTNFTTYEEAPPTLFLETEKTVSSSSSMSSSINTPTTRLSRGIIPSSSAELMSRMAEWDGLEVD